MAQPKEDEQRVPNQSIQEPTTYPSDMERERKEPDGTGRNKPKPSDVPEGEPSADDLNSAARKNPSR